MTHASSAAQFSIQHPMTTRINIDTVILVARSTLFSPFFVALYIIILIAQNHPYNATLVTLALYLALLVAYRTASYLSRIIENRAWIHGFKGLLEAPVLDWDDTIVLITGGSSGVGRLLAETLALRSITVVVLDITPLDTRISDTLSFYKCDLKDPTEIDSVAQKVIRSIGHPTILVNNAGVVHGHSITQLAPAMVRTSFAVNVEAHFHILRNFLPAMLAQGKGHVVTVSSIFGYVSAANMADYVASKHAARGLHDALKHELRTSPSPNSIRTTLVAPALVKTNMFAHIRPYNMLASFFAPAVEPTDLVKHIIITLEKNQSSTILLPWLVSWIHFYDLLPYPVCVFLRNLIGIDTAMRPKVQ